MPNKIINKSDIIEEIALLFNIPKTRAARIVNAIFDEMVDSLQKGQRIEFRGFGSLTAKEYDGYIGRNPESGEETIVPAKRRIRFRMSEVLFAELNKDLDG